MAVPDDRAERPGRGRADGRNHHGDCGYLGAVSGGHRDAIRREKCSVFHNTAARVLAAAGIASVGRATDESRFAAPLFKIILQVVVMNIDGVTGFSLKFNV